MISVKSQEEISLMREGGKRLGEILQKLLDFARASVTLLQIDEYADRLISQAGGTPSFKTVKGYKWATCLCVNEVVVHGVPTDYTLAEGDILNIDIGMLYHGLHTDTAWTTIIKNSKFKIKNYEEEERFLKVGEEALKKAIEQVRIGNRIGHISQAIQQTIEGAGYSIVKTLVGHGVGRELHEAPQVPGLLRGQIEDTLILSQGMTLALEVIYAQGKGDVVYSNDDGWTIATKDGSISAVFEHTVAVGPPAGEAGANSPLVLTAKD